LKICSRCKIEKPRSGFYKNARTKDLLQSSCKSCRSEIEKTYRDNNKQIVAERLSKLRPRYVNRNRKFIYEYLLVHPCVDCGENDPIVLQFDHLKDKLYGISHMITQGASIKLLELEISKCEVRCANCHQRKTSKQQNWYKSYANL
jgi:hypothetical protein